MKFLCVLVSLDRLHICETMSKMSVPAAFTAMRSMPSISQWDKDENLHIVKANIFYPAYLLENKFK